MAFGAFPRTPSAPRLKTRRVWDVDACPAHMVTAWNDEFDTPRHDAGGRWIARPNWSGLTAVDQNRTVPGALWTKNPPTGGTSTYLIRAILQTLPPGDWTAILAMDVPPIPVQFQGQGLILTDNASAGAGTQATAEITSLNTGFWNFRGVKWTNYNTYSGSTPVLATTGLDPTGVIVRIRCVAGAYFFGFSNDGCRWYEASATLGFTPTHLGLFTHAVSTGGSVDQGTAFRYFRVFRSGTATWGGYRTVREF